MNARTILVTLVSGLAALSAQAGTGLAGKTFQVDVLEVGRPGIESSCMSFHHDGRLEFGRGATAMSWVQPYGASDEFVAVSGGITPSLRSINVGTHGLIISGHVLVGTTIDQYGNSMLFLGAQVERCDEGRPAPTPSRDCLRSAEAQGGDLRRALANCATMPYLDDPAQPYSPPASCQGTQCDTQASSLANRSFTVGIGNDYENTQCWSFDAKGSLQVVGGNTMIWAPDYLNDTRISFQSVSSGRKYPGTFYGELLDDVVLDIRGVAEHEDGPRATYGVGFEVNNCTDR